VIDAGMYDGSLGIIVAIAAVKALNIEGKLDSFPRPVEVKH
jgi:allantoate deiminase